MFILEYIVVPWYSTGRCKSGKLFKKKKRSLNLIFYIFQYFKKATKLGDQAKKLKTQIWSSVVTIVLVEGSSLLPMDDNGFSDPYVKFRLGNEKYKSKVRVPFLIFSGKPWVMYENFDKVCFQEN